MEESLFSLTNPEFWVLVALVVFFGLLVMLKVIPGALFSALDGHAAKIQSELDEARSLREEAKAMLDGVKAQREEAEAQAKAMLAAAKDEAVRLQAEASAKLTETIARRAALAERKIANAQAEAEAQVKAAAVDLAAQAAEAVLVSRLAAAKTDPLADSAIGEMAGMVADIGVHHRYAVLAGAGQQVDTFRHGADHAGGKQGRTFGGVAAHEIDHQ